MRGRSVPMAAVLVALAASSALAAHPFIDVPRTHWAYDSVQKAVHFGILQGRDGIFDGDRQTNRYEMAETVARLLEVDTEALRADRQRELEARGVKVEHFELGPLVEVLGEELGAQKARVATFEADLMALRRAATDVAPAAPDNGGFTAFASVALVETDDDWGAAGASTDAIGGLDGPSFDVPQVSLGLDREISSGTVFHAQFDVDALVNGGSGGVSVNEAYVLFDSLFMSIDGKVGAFALPFSKEHRGPFRTCDLTVSASVLGSYVEAIRGYGVELGDSLGGRLDGLSWTFGVVSGTDQVSPTGGLAPFALSALQPSVNGGREGDDGFGYYVQIADGARKDRPFGWYAGYFVNGGDPTATEFTPSPETDFLVVGVDYAEGDLRVLAGYLDGSSEFGADVAQTMWYVLLNVALTDRNGMTVRFDDWKLGSGGPNAAGQALTFAFNRKISANQMLQFEWVSPDLDTAVGVAEPKDDLVQIRYKVTF